MPHKAIIWRIFIGVRTVGTEVILFIEYCAVLVIVLISYCGPLTLSLSLYLMDHTSPLSPPGPARRDGKSFLIFLCDLNLPVPRPLHVYMKTSTLNLLIFQNDWWGRSNKF